MTATATPCRAGAEAWSITGAPDRDGRMPCPACRVLVATTTDPVRGDLRVIGPHDRPDGAA